MIAGKRDHRIRIERRGPSVDTGYGTEAGDWLTVGEAWAEVQDMLPSKEQPIQGLNMALRPARVRMDYAEGINSAMRIVLLDRDDRILEIVTEPAEMGRKQGLEFVAQTYSTAGV